MDVGERGRRGEGEADDIERGERGREYRANVGVVAGVLWHCVVEAWRRREVTAVDVPQRGVTHDKRIKIKPTLDNKLVNIITSLVLLLSCFVSPLVDGIGQYHGSSQTRV